MTERSLYVLRHGKSDWGADYTADHDRPLKKRGRKAAEAVGRLLARSEEEPELILCSSALRTVQTLECAAAAGDWGEPRSLRTDSGLYGASSSSLLEAVRSAGAAFPDVERILLVGHEPGCSGLVGLLSGGVPPVYPTATLARLDLEGHAWSELGPGCAQLAWLLPPRLVARFVAEDS